MQMQIKLDSDAIKGLFPILSKPNKDFRFSQMQINIKNNVLQMVALNNCIIGIYERPLGEGYYKVPMTKKYHSQVQWDFVENGIKKTVVLMPMVL